MIGRRGHDPRSTAPEALGSGDPVPPGGGGPGGGGGGAESKPEPAAAAKAAAEKATAAAAEATAAATAAAAAKPEAAKAAAAKAAAAATAAAEAAQAAATAATAATAAARPVAPARSGGSERFLRNGFRDFKSNIKRTWPVILGFVIYLIASASALYGFLRVSARIPSWLQALYSTWVSMSTAGELTTRSSKWVWAFGAANLLVGLLFFRLHCVAGHDLALPAPRSLVLRSS